MIETPIRKGGLGSRHVACGAAFAVFLATTLTLTRVAADEPDADLTTRRSIWEGVYTEAQAQRAAAVYDGPCSRCHGYRLDGAPDDPDMFSTPPIAGDKFLREWDGRSLALLLEYTRATMPENNPGHLSDREYTDLIAYMLAKSGLPAGERALEADPEQLARIVIRSRRQEQ